MSSALLYVDEGTDKANLIVHSLRADFGLSSLFFFI